MAPGAPLLQVADPLALRDDWPCPVALTPLERALEQSLLASGLSRAEWLKRLAARLHRPQLLPLLWLLPRGWKLAPAQLPARLRSLAEVLERGLLTPSLLASLADDLPHLLPSPGPERPDALDLWCSRGQPSLPTTLEALLALPSGGGAEAETDPLDCGSEPLDGGLRWHNAGLRFEQSAPERQRNTRIARVLNRLGANRLGGETWSIDGCNSSSAWLTHLEQQGWRARAQLRCSVASFGLGACLPLPDGRWSQVPLALPIRTGLLDGRGQELQALLPHSCLELQLSQGETRIQVQYYQGTEGLCGWEGLNDLQRPWQNDRRNGTVRYLGEPLEGQRLSFALELCEWIALIHNQEASDRRLLHGGYGALGFCIDSSALLQQCLEGRCQLFPVLLGGIWRERLLRRSRALVGQGGEAQDRYQQALAELPHDGSLHGEAAQRAQQRLLGCQPSNSPFELVNALRVASL